MFSDPIHNIQQFRLTPNMQVADMGSGSGFYALAAAETLRGDTGRVFAIDVQKELLERTLAEAQRKNLDNIEIVWGDIETHQGTKLRNESIDAVILANILFQLERKDDALVEAHRILKPGGRILVIDWTDSFGGLGPAEDHIVKKETARELLEKNGFTFEQDIEAGKHHYGSIFHKTS